MRNCRCIPNRQTQERVRDREGAAARNEKHGRGRLEETCEDTQADAGTRARPGGGSGTERHGREKLAEMGDDTQDSEKVSMASEADGAMVGGWMRAGQHDALRSHHSGNHSPQQPAGPPERRG